MATEKRNLTATFAASGSWTDDSNAYTEDDNYAYTTDLDASGDYGRCPFEDITQTPDSLDDFQIKWFDSNSDHTDDTLELQIYNNHTTSWETLETFNSGNIIHTSLEQDNHTAAMQSKFAAATDKTAFLNNLQVQLIVTVQSGGKDDPRFAVAWCNFTYTYTTPPLTIYEYDDITVVDVPTILFTFFAILVFDLITLAAVYTNFTVINDLTGFDVIGLQDGPTMALVKDISTWAELDDIRNGLASYYRLTTNLNSGSPGYSTYAAASANGGLGWLPVGSSSTPFIGRFDGANYTISDLRINNVNATEAGLFGYSKSLEITRVGIVNCIVTADNDASYAGGLVGFQHWDAGPVNFCFCTGSVTGGFTGGLIGQNYGVITLCSTYNMVLDGDHDIGGLIGYNQGNITNCYSRATVNSDEYAGGLIGYCPAGIIDKCYSAGAVSGSIEGGLMAYATGATVTNSFWDTETSGQAASAGGTGKTTSQMQDVDTFTETDTPGLTNPWDFINNPNDDTGNEDYWAINGTYPYLLDFDIIEKSVYEIIGLTDIGTVEFPFYSVNVDDDIGLQDEIGIEFCVHPEVYDSIGVTDEATLVIPILEVSVFDLLTATDASPCAIPVLEVNIFDSLTVTDVPLIEIPILEVSVDDTIGLQDEPTVALSGDYAINVDDDIGLQDVPLLVFNFYEVYIDDDIGLQDIPTVATTGTLSVSVFDYIYIRPVIYKTRGYDSLTVTEDSTLEIQILEVSVDDTLGLQDEPTVSIESDIRSVNVNDTITVTEDVTVLIPLLPLSVYETIGVTDMGHIGQMSVYGNYFHADLAASGWLGVVRDVCYINGLGGDSTMTLNVSDPTTPTLRDKIIDAVNLNGAECVIPFGRYALVTCIYANSIHILDILDPDNITIVKTIVDGPGENGYLQGAAGACIVENIGDYARVAFIVAYNTDRLTSVDLSDPLNAVILDSIYHANINQPTSCVYHEGSVFVPARISKSLGVFDGSDPANLSYTTALFDAASQRFERVGICSDTVFNDRMLLPCSTTDRLNVINIGTPSSPYIEGSVQSLEALEGAYVPDYVTENFCVCTARYGNGVALVDLSTPATPVVIDWLRDEVNLEGTDDCQWTHDLMWSTLAEGSGMAVVKIPQLEGLVKEIDIYSDNVGVTDAVEVVINSTIAVDDGIGITDGVTLEIPVLQTSAFDTIGLQDEPTIAVSGALVVNVNDLITVAENVSLEVPILEVSIFETIGLQDTPLLAIPVLEVNTTETIGLQDAPVVAIPVLEVLIYDTIGLQDESIVVLGAFIVSIADNVLLTDAVDLSIPTLEVSVSDTLTLVDEPIVVLASYTISVYETIDLQDASPVEFAVYEVAVNDTLTLVDTPTVRLDLYLVVVDDDIQLTDEGLASIGVLAVNISDTLTVVDSSPVEFQIYEVAIDDDLQVTDVVPIEIAVYEITRYELIGLQDIQTVVLQDVNIYNVFVTDTLQLTGVVFSSLPIYEVLISDAITLIDVPLPFLVGIVADERFEATPGYDWAGWAEIKSTGCVVDEDYATTGWAAFSWQTDCLRLYTDNWYESAYTWNLLDYAHSILYTRFEVEVPAATLAITEAGLTSFRLLSIYQAAWVDMNWTVRVNAADGTAKFALTYGTGSGDVTDWGLALEASRRYRVEVFYDYTSGAWEWRVNGASQGSGSDTLIDNQQLVAIGNNDAPQREFFIDNITIHTNDWIGSEDIHEPDITEAVAVTDVSTIEIPVLEILVYDTLTVTDSSLLQTIPYLLTVFDSLSLTDLPILAITVPYVLSTEAIGLTDVALLAIPILEINVADTIAITDIGTVEYQLYTLIVFDTIAVTDVSIISIPDLEIVTTDSVTVSDVTTVIFQVLEIAEADSIGLTDTTTIFLPWLSILISDSLTVVDAVVIDVFLPRVVVTEAITVTDSCTVTIPYLRVEIADSIGVTDYTKCSLALLVNVADILTLTDGVEFGTPTFDVLGVTDAVSLAINTYFINVYETVVVTDNLTMTRVIPLAGVITGQSVISGVSLNFGPYYEQFLISGVTILPYFIHDTRVNATLIKNSFT